MDKKFNLIIKQLFQTSLECNDYELLFDFINGIKNNPNLISNYCETFFEELVNLLPNIEDDYLRTVFIKMIIDSALEIQNNMVEVEENRFNKMRDELFEEYVLLLNQCLVPYEEVAGCLFSFMSLGVDLTKIISKVSELQNRDHLLSCLVRFSPLFENDTWDHFPSCFGDFRLQIEKRKKVFLRSSRIVQFFVLVNPYLRDYSVKGPFHFVYDFEGALMDYRIFEMKHSEYLIRENVIDEIEAEIFNELVELLNDRTILLDSPLIFALYDKFVRDRNLFEVIFKLPNEETLFNN